MLTTLLIQRDTKQLVLTPETESEKAIFKMFPEDVTLSIKRGSFFSECRGGYIREFSDDHSLMLIMEDSDSRESHVSPKPGYSMTEGMPDFK